MIPESTMSRIVYVLNGPNLTQLAQLEVHFNDFP